MSAYRATYDRNSGNEVHDDDRIPFQNVVCIRHLGLTPEEEPPLCQEALGYGMADERICVQSAP